MTLTLPESLSREVWLAVVGIAGTTVLTSWLQASRWIRGSTLMAAWGWAGLSLAVQTAAAALYTIGKVGAASPWLYLAAITVFGPIMAVLGAKRPQHRAWQLIVLVLLLVLALPGLEALAFARSVTVHGLLGALMALLVALGVFNYLPTRFWPACVCLAIAQGLLIAPYITSSGPTPHACRPIAALILEGLAGLIAAIQQTRTVPARRGIDRLWIDFRNSLGSIWALRVQERFNAAARQHGWPVRLEWAGLRVAPGTDPSGPLAQRTLRMLLRRFVSDGWIQRRSGE